MEQDLYELIEAYLDGTLPDEKRLAVEERMAADEGFKQEVMLHRDLQEAYSDPGRWQLKMALQAAMEEPLPATGASDQKSDTSNKSMKWWWFILPFALLLCTVIWYLSKPATVAPGQIDSNTPSAKQPNTQPEKDQQIKPEQENKPTVEKPNVHQPMAMADPANFQENRSMEGLIATRGDGPLTVIMNHPQIGERFDPRPSGKTDIRFSGSVAGLPINEPIQLTLLIFNNKDIKKPQWRQTIQWKGDSTGKTQFEIPALVNFSKGLFYFRIEEGESGDIVAAGKFFIGSL